MREQEFPPFAFTINSSGFPEIIEGYITDKNSKEVLPEAIDIEVHQKVLKEIFKNQKILSQAQLSPF